jgi:hypothetical protein
MTQAGNEDPRTAADEAEIDTIEMVLKQEDLAELDRIMDTQIAASQPAPAVAPVPIAAVGKPRRRGLVFACFAAAAAIIFISLFSIETLHATKSAVEPAAATQTARSADSLPAQPPTAAGDAATQDEVVRLRNPFDRSEVFEFPPGTTPIEARDAVSRILLERARERQRPPTY